MPITRPAVADDADAVFALAERFATSFRPERSRFDAAWVQLLAQQDASVWVAEEPAACLTGYLLGFDHPTFFANGRVAWVEEIMVAEPWRGRGHGRSLMAAFELWARGRGAVLVALATRRAAAFYRALGYEESAAYYRKRL